MANIHTFSSCLGESSDLGKPGFWEDGIVKPLGLSFTTLLCFPALADLHGDGEYKVGNQKVEWGKLRSEICKEGQHTLEPKRHI